MKTISRTMFLVLTLIFSACNDKGSPEVPAVADPPSADPPAGEDVPSTFLPACGTNDPGTSAEVDALPGGIWYGSLADCEHNTRFDHAMALVSEDGRFRIIGQYGHLLSGNLQMDGNRFYGIGVDFARTDIEYFSGPTTDLFIQGTMSERSFFAGSWGTEWGFYGKLGFEYSEELYEKPSSFDALAGVWPLGRAEQIDGVLTIEPDGRFNGQDDSGCLLSGHFSLIDDRYSLLDVSLAITACDVAGTYTGLAYHQELVDWWEEAVEIYVDDGQRVMRIVLLK